MFMYCCPTKLLLPVYKKCIKNVSLADGKNSLAVLCTSSDTMGKFSFVVSCCNCLSKIWQIADYLPCHSTNIAHTLSS